MNTLFIGKNMLFLPEVDSTNTYATNLLRNVKVIDGTVVYTHNQTNGKGQRGALWSAEIGKNVTLSIILKPNSLSVKNAFYLSKITALACYDVLTELLNQSQFDIRIKWPNDILVNRKKIAGVLIENTVTETVIQNTVIGIGLNVNQTEFGALQNLATSLCIELNQSFEIKSIIEMFCSKLEKWYLKLNQNNYDEIDVGYLDKLFGLNTITIFEDVKQQKFEGIVENVEKNGSLKVKKTTEEIVYFEVKEVKFII